MLSVDSKTYHRLGTDALCGREGKHGELLRLLVQQSRAHPLSTLVARQLKRVTSLANVFGVAQ